MSDVTNFPKQIDLVEKMKGPTSSASTVIIEGRGIPGLTMLDEGESVQLILNNRFSIDVPRGRAAQVAWFVAQALAIGSGYSHSGAESRDMPFAPRVFNISEGEGER